MTNILDLQIDRAQGSLQRVIGLIERRGFHIERMNVSDHGAHRDVRLIVVAGDATRCADVLRRQIDRLIGVRRLGAPAPNEEVAVCPA